MGRSEEVGEAGEGAESQKAQTIKLDGDGPEVEENSGICEERITDWPDTVLLENFEHGPAEKGLLETVSKA